MMTLYPDKPSVVVNNNRNWLLNRYPNFPHVTILDLNKILSVNVLKFLEETYNLVPADDYHWMVAYPYMLLSFKDSELDVATDIKLRWS
jgi:hypothetical protein